MQDKWWQTALTVLFLLGLIICVFPVGEPKSQGSSTVLLAPKEPEMSDSVRAAVQDTRFFFQDLGTLYLRIANALGQAAPAVLGYLGCVMILLLPFGLWALMNIGWLLRASPLNINLSSTTRN